MGFLANTTKSTAFALCLRRTSECPRGMSSTVSAVKSLIRVASPIPSRQLLHFTITFRSFSPTPGGLEFHPGQDYYFISTSSSADLHRRVGGGCSTQNMKMIFKVSNNKEEGEDKDHAS